MPNLGVPVPANGVAGVDVTAAFWNTQVRDAVCFLLNPPHCTAVQSVAQPVPSGVWVVITFDTHSVDNYNGHSTTVNPSRYTAQVPGWYRVSGVGTALIFSEQMTTVLAKNGVRIPGTATNAPGTANGVAGSLSATDVYLAAGDYVELWVAQTSGANVNTPTIADYRCSMSIARLSVN